MTSSKLQDIKNINKSKKLQIFLDGTANSAAEGHWASLTNIFRLILALNYEGNQIVTYMPGVGTRGDFTSIVTARGMDEILREAYVNLASNYLPGDEIYIFGYSRGGAIALALADIIAKVGLLRPDALHNLRAVWEVYLKRRGKKKLTPNEIRGLEVQHLNGNIWTDTDKPQINYLGLFDPVPGNKWDARFNFSEVRLIDPILPPNVAAACSILSIDDNRKPSFDPIVIMNISDPSQSLEQIWMPGVHADIGGNSSSVFLSDVALLTMISDMQLKCPGLSWSTSYIKDLQTRLERDKNIEIDNERSHFMKKILFKGQREIGRSCLVQNIIECEKIHPVFDYLYGKKFSVRGRQKIYAPNNVQKDIRRYVDVYGDLYKNVIEDILTSKTSK